MVRNINVPEITLKRYSVGWYSGLVATAVKQEERGKGKVHIATIWLQLFSYKQTHTCARIVKNFK
jgi:hypothetical protein